MQIHLLPLKGQFYRGADLLVAADCCSYAYAGFHQDFIKDHTLAIGCPKLDNADAYREKLATILKENDIRSVAVAYMEVPCCAGLVKLVEAAVKDSGKKIPVKKTKIGIQGGSCNSPSPILYLRGNSPLKIRGGKGGYDTKLFFDLTKLSYTF